MTGDGTRGDPEAGAAVGEGASLPGGTVSRGTASPSAFPNVTDSVRGAFTRTREFWLTAARERFVSVTVAEQKATETPRLSEAEDAVSSGLLTAAQAEIVTHLLDPLGLVPGYELLGHLGHGGMGVVYKARQIAFDRIVALKTVLIGTREQGTALARFEQEARSLGRLVHPHLVTAYDFSRHGGRLSLAMEFIAGTDGERWAARNAPAGERIVWGMIRQAAAGLSCAAAAGLIHRDVKPANLLLTDPPPGFPLEPGLPLVKVADFGLSLLAEGNDEATRLTLENMAVGSPHFMAPEQLAGDRIDQRADIYALGATAYQFLSGKRPWGGLPLIQILSRKLQEDPEPITSLRSDLSPGTVRLLEELLQRDPEQRLSNYDDLLSRIGELLEEIGAGGDGASPGMGGTGSRSGSGSGSVATATTAVGTTSADLAALGTVVFTPETLVVARPKRRVSRRGWIRIGSAGVAAVAVAGLGWWGLTGQGARPGPRIWRPTGEAEACYDGQSLRGWRVLSGQWIPAREDGDGGRVLAGIDGVIAHPTRLGQGKLRRILAGYQVIAIAAVHEAAAAEVQFGLRASSRSETGGDPGDLAGQGVVRLTADRVVLGTRRMETGTVDRMIAERELSGGAQAFHEIRVERQPEDWYVVVDGELLGSVPAGMKSGEKELPEFRLAAESRSGTPGGEAWFGDLLLEELGVVPAGQAGQ